MEETLFKLARVITDTGTDTVSSKGGTITYRITSLKRKLVNGKVVSTSTPSCTLSSASVNWAIWGGVTVGDGYLDVKINYSINIGSSRSTTLTFAQNGSNNKINLTVTQESQMASTFTLSGLPTGTGYYLFGKGARPRNTSPSDRSYIQGISATGTTTMRIPFEVNDSEPGSRIECTTGDIVAVYTKLGATQPWILKGSFIVPSAGGTVSISPEEEKEYWEIRFNPIEEYGVDMSAFFYVTTNISREGGSMSDSNRKNKDWIVNQNRYAINVYISNLYPGNFDILSWSCLDKNGNAFSPNYNLPSNSYFTIKTTGLGSYTLTKVSTPSASSDTPILSSRFNPTKKYPLDLNFYCVAPT